MLAILATLLLLALAVITSVVFQGNEGLSSHFSSIIREELQDHLKTESDLLYSLANVQIWDTGVLFLAAVLLFKQHRTEAALLVVGLLVDVAVQLMKALETPINLSGISLADLLAAASVGSFPSGHVARTTVSLGLLVALFFGTLRRWRIPTILLATGFLALIGAVSVASGGHKLADVLGAYLLAALWVDLLMLAKITSRAQMSKN